MQTDPSQPQVAAHPVQPQAKRARPFKRIDYVYKEYVRLSERLDTYIRGSFADFKMLSAVGGLSSAALSGVALLVKEGEVLAGISLQALAWMAFIGFLSILALVAILSFRDLLKQSLATGLTVHLCEYEKVLREQLDLAGTNTFKVNLMGETWMKAQHEPIAVRFQIVFTLWLTAIPSLVLARVQPEWYFAPSYLFLCVALLALRLYTGARFLQAFRIPTSAASSPAPASSSAP